MSEEIALPVVENTPQPESTDTKDGSNLKVDQAAQEVSTENVQLLLESVESAATAAQSIVGEIDEAAPDDTRKLDTNLIDIINSMEEDRKKFIAHVHNKIASQDSEFERVKSENVRLRARITEVELCLRQNNIDVVTSSLTAKPKKGNKATANDDDILTQAKTLLFEKTKICKQQEQQLAALKTQVEATKEVLTVTKEMLCLRNIENDHTQARLETLDLKLRNERARQELSEKKAQTSQKLYADLRAEYDLQSKIFKQLRSGYEEKIGILAKQIETLKS